MSISAGKLLHSITVVRVLETPDGGGGAISTFVPYWTTKARIGQLKSVRTIQANQDKLTNGLTFSLRYRKDKQITTDMLIEYKGIRYAINSCENVGHNNDELLIIGMAGSPILTGTPSIPPQEPEEGALTYQEFLTLPPEEL